MNANELANLLEVDSWYKLVTREEIAIMLRQQQEQIDKLTAIVALREMDIEALNQRIERMIENQSHHEGIAHAGGFEQGHEVGRKLGMQQERALWELAAPTQEIMK